MNFDLNPYEALSWCVECGMRNVEMDIPWIDEKLIPWVELWHAYGNAQYHLQPAAIKAALRPDENP